MNKQIGVFAMRSVERTELLQADTPNFHKNADSLSNKNVG